MVRQPHFRAPQPELSHVCTVHSAFPYADEGQSQQGFIPHNDSIGQPGGMPGQGSAARGGATGLQGNTHAAGLVAIRATLALTATCAGCQDVDAVVADLVAARLVSVVAVLRPVVTYKG